MKRNTQLLQFRHTRIFITITVQLPATANPPHRLSLELGVIIFTRLASHIYDLGAELAEVTPGAIFNILK